MLQRVVTFGWLADASFHRPPGKTDDLVLRKASANARDQLAA
jgi:hypothetical protein